jgi:hypothetical protein
LGRQRFWRAMLAASRARRRPAAAGVSAAVGVRWFREGGGMLAEGGVNVRCLTRHQSADTKRTHQKRHARRLATHRCRLSQPICRKNCVASDRACTRMTPGNLHGKEGSPVRVRKRASIKTLQMGLSRCLPRRKLRSSRIRDGYILGLAGSRGHARRLVAHARACPTESIAATDSESSCKKGIWCCPQCHEAEHLPHYRRRRVVRFANPRLDRARLGVCRSARAARHS